MYGSSFSGVVSCRQASVPSARFTASVTSFPSEKPVKKTRPLAITGEDAPPGSAVDQSKL
jgi:hypothetical protein